MADRSSSSATVSRTKCARWSGGTKSNTEGGNSSCCWTLHSRKVLAIAHSTKPAPAVSTHFRTPPALPGQTPSAFPGRAYVESGGLLGYGPDLRAIAARAATYVDISKHV